jgi:hypothetical protein
LMLNKFYDSTFIYWKEEIFQYQLNEWLFNITSLYYSGCWFNMFNVAGICHKFNLDILKGLPKIDLPE